MLYMLYFKFLNSNLNINRKYPTELALCEADRHSSGSVLTIKDRIFCGGRLLLEHRDVTRRKGEQKHIVSFSKSCAV